LSACVISHSALAFVGVGSNIRPAENIVRALEFLTKTPEVTLTGISTFYRTAALPDPADSTAPPDQGLLNLDPDFLNGVLEIRTTLMPVELLSLLTNTERALGRQRPSNRYASRTMDLDLLLFGRKEEERHPPVWEKIGPSGYQAHSDIERRPWVAHPLLELAPDLILPHHGMPLRALAASFDTPGGQPETDFTNTLRSSFLSP